MFWGLGHQIPNFDGYIYIHYAAPPYSARISPIYFFLFGNAWLGSVSVCNAWEVQCRIYEGRVRTLILFLAVCGPKFMKYSDDVGSPLYFPTPFSVCLCHISFRRYSPLSLEVVEKWRKCKSFLPPIFVGGTAPTFLRQFVRATDYPLLGKVWLSSVCSSPSAKRANKAECRIYRGRVSFKPFVDQSTWHFGTM